MKLSTADSSFAEPVRRRILAASRVLGWTLAAAMLLGAIEGVGALRDQAAARRLKGDHNRRDFIQRVIACRHPKGLPARPWNDCEFEVQNAL